MNLWTRRSLWTLAGLAGLGALARVFVPRPLPVETGTLARGPLRVEVEAEGQTRVKHRYVVSAPVGGVISRPEQRPGDLVRWGEALVTLTPIEPPLLDGRTQAQADAQVRVASAARAQAEAQVDLVRTTLAFAQKELDRERMLTDRGAAPTAGLEAAELRVHTAEQQLAAARMGVTAARFQEDAATAATSRATGRGTNARVALRAPVDGRVLRVLVTDGGVITAGTPILELADPTDLEVVVELLSTDAVAVRPGAPVSVLRWGGPAALTAAVRSVEPIATTKLSTLGVEEQRVRVIADFEGDPNLRGQLGDGYRVDARVVLADLPDVLRIPMAALFRSGDQWATFAVRDRRAILSRLKLGQRNETWAEVVSGLEEGARVVLRPVDRLEDGARVEPRPGAEAQGTPRTSSE
jgi:HlyD family secretion protein